MTKKQLPHINLDDELAWLEVEDAMFDLQESGRELADAWTDFAMGNVDKDVHPDAPLTLEQAVCLPELQGVFTASPDYRQKSESITVKTLRGAIDKGDLECRRPNKNIFVTRTQIAAWMEKCLDRKNPPTSSSARRDATLKAESRTRPSTTSMTTESSTRRDAALKILQELKQNSGNTSSKSTRK
jgi:hypothetical protein